MKIDRLGLDGVFVIVPDKYSDDRGWFTESWNAEKMAAAGLDLNFVQDNHSYSARKGTLRGLHYQAPPHMQDKLVRCTRGAVLDVAVDFRIGSPSYAKWIGTELSAENGHQLLVPQGFLHGFLTLTDDVEVHYKCTDVYAAECEGSVHWDDPTIGVNWAMAGELSADAPYLSPKDAQAPTLADVASPFVWEGAS